MRRRPRQLNRAPKNQWRHSRGSGTAEAGCRSEHSRSEWPEGRAAGAARNPFSFAFSKKMQHGFPLSREWRLFVEVGNCLSDSHSVWCSSSKCVVCIWRIRSNSLGSDRAKQIRIRFVRS